MSDLLSELQREAVVLLEIMYNTIGILQRDADSIPLGKKREKNTEIEEVKNRLLDDFVKTSTKINRSFLALEKEIAHKNPVKKDTNTVEEQIFRIEEKMTELKHYQGLVEQKILEIEKNWFIKSPASWDRYKSSD